MKTLIPHGTSKIRSQMANSNTYSNVMFDLKNRSNVTTDRRNRSNVMADRKNRSENEIEDVYENINTEKLSTKSPDNSVPKSSTMTQEQNSRGTCAKSITITWWRIIIVILLFAILQSLVIVFVLKSNLINVISTESFTTHANENTNIRECGSPPPVEHSHQLMTGNNTGTVVMYACLENYYPKGIPAVFCQSDGNWSTIQFSCIKENESEKIHEEIRKLNSTLKSFKKRQERQHALGFQDFEFNKSTLSKYRYLSNDNRTVSNYKMITNMEKGNGFHEMNNGVIGTRPFTKYDILYYEVSVYYNVSHIKPRYIVYPSVFELGFCTFDNNVFLKRESITFLYSPSKNVVDVKVRDTKGKSHYIKSLPLLINNSFFGTFSLYVDGPGMKINFFVRRGDDLAILYTFTDVNFEKHFYPSFVLSSKFTGNISLTLKTRKFIKIIPEQLYEYV